MNNQQFIKVIEYKIKYDCSIAIACKQFNVPISRFKKWKKQQDTEKLKRNAELTLKTQREYRRKLKIIFKQSMNDYQKVLSKSIKDIEYNIFLINKRLNHLNKDR